MTTGQRGNGVNNTDFILYVSAKSMERCSIGTTVAYAAYCQLEDALDRYLGQVNWVRLIRSIHTTLCAGGCFQLVFVSGELGQINLVSSYHTVEAAFN